VADPAPGWRRAAPWLLAALFYVACALIQTWPLATHLPNVIPNDLGDPVLNAWIVWWNAHAVPFTATWWNAPAFWPSNGALAFSEVLVGLSPITTPIQWLGGSAITAYNVAFLLTFPLSALAAHALVFRLTRRHDAGVIAGLIYGFHPFRTAHFPQIQVMTSYWMPLALLGLHEYLESRKARWLWIAATAWLMQALSNGYYLLFFPVLLGLWMVWFALSRSTLRTFAAIATAFVVASLPLIPLLWTYKRIHSAFNFQRDLGEISGFGADVMSLLDASPLLEFWNLHSFHQAEGELFPGLTAAALILLLAMYWLWTSGRLTRPPRAVLVALAGAVLFTVVALSALVLGPWSIRIGGLTLLSVRVISKPLSAGVVLFLVALALLPGVSSARRRRSPLLFYVVAMGLMYLLCFGPQPHVLGTPFMYRGPYALLMMLPGYDAVRVPARFAMLAAMCVSVVAAMAFARLTARAGRTLRLALAAVVVAGVAVDSAIGAMPLKPLPRRLVTFESLPPGTAVMELPLGELAGDLEAMFRGMYHGRPVVNGYSGFFPRSYEVLRRALESHDPQIFDSISAWGPVVVMIDTARDPGGAWATQLENRSGTTSLGQESGWKVFSLPGGERPPDVDFTERLPIEAMAANINGDHLPLAVDGNPNTRWSTGPHPQNGAEVLTIDLGAEHEVDALRMTIGTRVTDFPRRLIIESSIDNREWATRWEGNAAIVTFAAAVRHPGDVPLTFALPHVPARWIRLRQLGQDPEFYWSIFELTVFGK
jgi:hypothetical protein